MIHFVRKLADSMMLSALLETLRDACSDYHLVAHWQQGEFHHDIVLMTPVSELLPGPVLVVATNCNGGVKEVFCFADVPERYGLWRLRCPDNDEFAGTPPIVLAHEVTPHWFDPCELLLDTARSELREEFRQRQVGGGWQRKAEN